jgi:hypothetical protein
MPPGDAHWNGMETKTNLEQENETNMKDMIRTLTLTLASAALLGGAATPSLLADHRPPPPLKHQPRYDVAIDAATTRTLYSTNGTISRGDTFILNGYIYPGGTIPAEGKFNPTNTGSIGMWTCRGVYNVDLSDLVAGQEPAVYTTQYFHFNDGSMITTEGPEGLAPSRRVVTGGTSAFNGVNGEVLQQFLHFNDTLDVDGMAGLNFTFKFNFKKQLPR